MGTNIETYVESERLQNSLFLGLKNSVDEQGGRKCKSKARWKTPRTKAPLNQHDQYSYELTENEAACTEHACVGQQHVLCVYSMPSVFVFSWDF